MIVVEIDKKLDGGKIPLRVMQRLCQYGCIALGARGLEDVPNDTPIELVFIHSRGKRHVVKATLKHVQVNGDMNPRAFFPAHVLPIG